MITVVHAAAAEVPTEPVQPDQVISGDPVAGAVGLHSPPGIDAGIWEHSVGTSTDVEIDEVFVIISGRATIAVEGEPSVEIGPGDVVTLAEGTVTTWTVHETLRKVFVARAEAATPT